MLLPTYCASGSRNQMESSGLDADWFFIQKSIYLPLFPSHINIICLSHTRQCALQCNYLVFRKVSPFHYKSTSPHFDWCSFTNPPLSREANEASCKWGKSFLICLLYITWDFICFQFLLPSPKLYPLAQEISELPIILQMWVPNGFTE